MDAIFVADFVLLYVILDNLVWNCRI